jgi:hypothetical protein
MICATARDREPILGIGVPLVEADGGHAGLQALLRYGYRIIAPPPEGDSARYASQPDVRFGELRIDPCRFSEEVSRLLVTRALNFVELPNTSANETPSREVIDAADSGA